MKTFSYIVSVTNLIASVGCLTQSAWAMSILCLATSIAAYDHARSLP